MFILMSPMAMQIIGSIKTRCSLHTCKIFPAPLWYIFRGEKPFFYKQDFFAAAHLKACYLAVKVYILKIK